MMLGSVCACKLCLSHFVFVVSALHGKASQWIVLLDSTLSVVPLWNHD